MKIIRLLTVVGAFLNIPIMLGVVSSAANAGVISNSMAVVAQIGVCSTGILIAVLLVTLNGSMPTTLYNLRMKQISSLTAFAEKYYATKLGLSIEQLLDEYDKSNGKSYEKPDQTHG